MNKWQKLSSYDEAVTWAYSLTRSHNKVFTNDEGIKRSHRLMELLGSPQNAVPSIHVAGTTGKGTVCYMTSYALQAAGKRVGLILSPHVYDVRERCQVNNDLIDKETWLETLNEMMPALEQLEKEFGYANYYEVLFCHSMLIMSKAELDYVVIETGLGGLLDTSNTITRQDKVAVITKLGMDHEKILGDNLYDIATQKAGIIQHSNKVFVLDPETEAKKAIEKRAEEQHADIDYVPEGNYKDDLVALNLQLCGGFQASNAGLAKAVLKYLADRDQFDFNDSIFKKALESLRMPGRLEQVSLGVINVVFDGAHNGQKMEGFVSGLKKVFPGEKMSFVIAAGNSKKLSETMKPLMPLAEQIIFTGYEAARSDMNKKAHKFSAEELKKYQAAYITDHQEIARIIRSEGKKTWVVTGSFYVLGEIKDVLEENS